MKDILRSKLFLQVLVAVSLFFLSFWLAFFLSKLKDFTSRNSLSFDPKEVVPAKSTNENYENLLSVALLGQGGEGHSGGSLTDSIIILSADVQTKKATLISVPRDLWVPVPYDWEALKNFKINAAYTVGQDNVRYANKKPEVKGGGAMTKHVLESVTGIPISYYVAIDFNSYTNLIDEIGPIEVDVPKTFDDYYYPIKGLENETCGLAAEQIAEAHAKYSGFDLEKQFPCRWEHLHWDKGPVRLSGEEALKFVRSRHGDNDFGRSERQFAVLEGIGKKLISLGALGKSFSIVEDLTGLVRTDMNLSTIKQVITTLGNPDEYKLSEIHITEDNLVNASKTEDGQFILVPKAGNNNFEGVKEFIKSRI